jgi:hypothetical protein
METATMETATMETAAMEATAMEATAMEATTAPLCVANIWRGGKDSEHDGEYDREFACHRGPFPAPLRAGFGKKCGDRFRVSH